MFDLFSADVAGWIAVGSLSVTALGLLIEASRRHDEREPIITAVFLPHADSGQYPFMEFTSMRGGPLRKVHAVVIAGAATRPLCPYFIDNMNGPELGSIMLPNMPLTVGSKRVLHVGCWRHKGAETTTYQLKGSSCAEGSPF